MKKLIVFTFLITGLSTVALSQGIYLRVGAGYGLPAATAPIGENYLHNYDYNGGNPINEYSSETVSASFGAGTNFGFALGYKFNENLILDLNIQYLAGKKFETSNINDYSDGQYSTTDRSIVTSNSRAFYLNPSVVFSAGFGKGAPYGRFGIIASSPKIIDSESYYSDSDGVYTSEITWESKKGVGLGYQAAVGMNWKISEKMDVYGEVNFVSMTYYAKEAEMTKNNQNGNDILGQLTTYDTHKIYRDKFDPQAPYDPLKPQVEGLKSAPFSAVSAQVGIRFSIFQFGESY